MYMYNTACGDVTRKGPEVHNTETCIRFYLFVAITMYVCAIMNMNRVYNGSFPGAWVIHTRGRWEGIMDRCSMTNRSCIIFWLAANNPLWV